MRKMRQKADEGLLHLGQKTPNAPEQMNAARMAFRLNQSSVLCLPLVSDSQRLIWVSSNEFSLQLDGAAKLDEAFNRFPYLTQTQTAALAQRCSLHPDQVKVWFMVQRLRYGISWDYKDIPSVRSKVMSGRGKEGSQNRKGGKVKEDGGENKNCKREGEKKAGEVREEQSASEGRMTGENVGATERPEIEIKPEQPVKKDEDRKGEEDKRNEQKKRKRTTAADKMGKKRVKQGVAERAEGGEIRSEGAERESQKSTQTETTHFTRNKKKKKKKKKAKAGKSLLSVQAWPAHTSFVVPGENNLVADGSPAVTQQQGSLAVDTHTLPRRVRIKTKTRTQLAMMKEAFSNCQYPGVEDYNRLAMGINVPRYLLVQWFGDMRYYVKKSRPGWLTQEQYSKALANINYRQYLKALVKIESVPAPPNDALNLKTDV